MCLTMPKTIDPTALRYTGRRWTTVFRPEEWDRLQRHLDERRKTEPKITITDIIREFVGTL